MPDSHYVARGILRNGHTNSVLSGSVARKVIVHKQCDSFIKQGQQHIIPAGHGIKLSAYINSQKARHSPLVILLHGWLGCADSLYMLNLGDHLFNHGYHVVRLNFRDHGNSEHLNEKIFHSCRIQEVINACSHVQQYFDVPASIIGFSLGGNFALRINAFTTDHDLSLDKTVSICPVIDPANTLVSLENSIFIYQNYFMQRWKKSFHNKVDAHPKLYSKDIFGNFKSLRQATEVLAIKYAGFENLESYLNGYSIAGNRLSTVRAPASIVLAKDDPIIPWEDRQLLASNNNIDFHLSDHGGHCGFLNPDLTSPWINHFCLARLTE